MRVNSVRNQSFGANPSNLIRTCLAQAIAAGRDVEPLLKLIGEVHPGKYMTMSVKADGKVFSVGLTDKFESLSRIEMGDNPMYLQEIKKLHERIGLFRRSSKQTGACVIIGRPDGTYAHHASKEWKKEMAAFNKRLEKFHKAEAELKEKYPKVPVVKDPEGYISLFKDVEGKPFGDIIDTLITALAKLKKGQTATERAKDMIDARYPAYKDFATRSEVQSACRDATWWHQPIY